MKRRKSFVSIEVVDLHSFFPNKLIVLNKNRKAPAENEEINSLNPVEITGAGAKESVEMLRNLLGRKERLVTELRPSDAKGNEQLAAVKDSVQKRLLLAQDISPA